MKTCNDCDKRDVCTEICPVIEAQLPGIQAGEVHDQTPEDILWGRIVTQIILDYERHYKLSDPQKEVLNLYYRQGLEEPEIAKVLGIKQQAVNNRLQRARKRIGIAAKGR